MSIIPLIVFIATLFFVIVRPKKIGIGYSACVGALIVYLLGFVSNRDVLQVIQLTWNATFAFIALIVICFILNEIGIFEWAALQVIRLSKESCKRLFIYLIILGSLVAAFFANDGAALILTPIVIAKIKLLKIPKDKMMPFIMAGGFISDSASLPFITSNLVNIIAADYFSISYGSYAKYMVIPFFVSVLISLVMLYAVYKKTLGEICNCNWKVSFANPIQDRFLSFVSLTILLLMFISCFVGGYYKVPVSLILIPVGFLLSILALSKKVTSFKKIFKATPFSIIFFALGMFLIIMSLKTIGLNLLLAYLFKSFLSLGNFVATLFTGLLAGVLSCFINNLPAVMMTSLSISHLELPYFQETLLALANIIGSDIGPKMFPIGSLATLLWLHLIERQKIKITTRYFIKTGVYLTLPTLIGALMALYFWLSFLH